MKRLTILFGVILFLGIISASPLLYFIDPTPVNNYVTEPLGSFNLNISVTDVSNSSSIIFQWNGVNYSLYDEDLVLMLNLDNNSAIGENDSKVVDVSRYGNNGSVTSASFNSTGKYNGAFSFDADSEYINFSDSSGFRNENFSVSMWVNIESMSIKQISAQGYTTFFLLNDGNLYGVGRNDYGQLGISSTTDQLTPKLVLGGYNFSKLNTADYPDPDHMCGILQNGSLLCWGLNNYGQLGDSSTTQRTSPVAVVGNYNFTQISTGRYHSCGLLVNGTALCWGRNDKGQLGDNTTTQHTSPNWIYGNYNFSIISAGDDETCGLLVNGTALCWGRNDYGSIGDGTSGVYRYMPTPVSGNYNFSYITNGNQIVCGILTNGSAVCWGGNAGGSYLGNGIDASSSVPVFVSGNYNWSYIEQTYFSLCGLLTNGTPMCWGGNGLGQVGIGSKTVSVLSPTAVYGNHIFFRISSGYTYTCGILTDGSTRCWGRDSYNQMGKGFSAAVFPNPILFSYGNFSSNSYTNLSLGLYHACGLLYDGKVHCWGRNSQGELADGTLESRGAPLEINGSYTFGSVYSGGLTSCGILTNGTALCWGYNSNGQVGDGTQIDKNVTTPVLGGYNFSNIFVGVSTTCGILTNGTALCWGSNQYGQLGNGSTGGNALAPTPVAGGYNFTFISIGNFHLCGILTNGSGMCWGRDNNDQLGCNNCGDKNVPTAILGDYNFSSISSGQIHSCGILVNGSAICWGNNAYSQTGDNTTTSPRSVPVFVSGNYNFSVLNAAYQYSCGILTNGTVMCWGYNINGQLGDGTFTMRSSPNPIKLSGTFSYLYSAYTYNFGVLSDGRIVSWGMNSDAQQAFSNFDETIPTPGIYKGEVLGKNTSSFKIGSTFEGNLRAYTGYGFEDITLNNGWNHVVLTYNGTTANIYLNGSLVDSFNPPIFSWYNDTTNLILGEGIRGSVDEVRMWNRTLTSSEISEVYNSQLRKVNSSEWKFSSLRSSLIAGTYTYDVLFTDLSGQLFSTGLRNFIVQVATSEEASDSQNTGSSNGASEIIYRPTKEQIVQGYSKLLRKGYKVILPLDGRVTKIESVDSSIQKVSILIGDVSYELGIEDSVNIDSDDDGYYDTKISVEEIRTNGYVSILYNDIKEVSPVLVNSNQNETGVGEESNSSQILKRNIWIYVLIGFVIGVVIYFSFKKGNKKKRR